MELHNLKGNQYRRFKQRVGRGGKRGTTSGRGQKGQKSRSGRRIRPAERDLILKLPKWRGVTNKTTVTKPMVFNLGELLSRVSIAGKSEKPVVIDLGFFRKSGLLSKNFRGGVKILGNGDVKIAIEIRGLKVSAGAKEKIEKAGGKVVDAVPAQKKTS